ncbi:MAG: hypothetical protein DRH24_12700 [Deltaproteobacteria bacterium]|nr:MAG: hypothetical protein DRH24_12700 [Deltaproteobacteria bacterium]
MNEIKTISKGAFWLLVGFGASKLATLAFRVISARLFGVEVYGNFVVSFTLFSAISLISVFGLPLAMEYFFPRVKRSLAKGILLESLMVSTLISVALSSVLVLFFSYVVELFNVTDPSMLLIFLLITPIGAVSEILASVFRAYKNMKWEVLYKRVLPQVGVVVFLVLFSFLKLRSISIALSFALSYLLAAGVMFFVIRSSVFHDVRARRFNVIKLLGYAVPVSLSLMMMFLMVWEDNLIISYFLGPSAAGLYGSAAPISQFLILPASMFSVILLPVLSGITAGSKRARFVKVLSFSARWTLMLSLLFAIPIMIFSKLVLSLLFGSTFIGASTALSILAIGYVLFGLSQIFGRVLMSYNKPNLYMLTTVISVIANFVLNILLVPVLGINGAAVGTFSSMFILLVLTYLFVRFACNVTISDRRLFVGLLILIILSVLLYIASHISVNVVSVLVLAVLYFVSFFALLYILRVLTDEEIEMLKLLFARLNRKRY